MNHLNNRSIKRMYSIVVLRHENKSVKYIIDNELCFNVIQSDSFKKALYKLYSDLRRSDSIYNSRIKIRISIAHVAVHNHNLTRVLRIKDQTTIISVEAFSDSYNKQL